MQVLYALQLRDIEKIPTECFRLIANKAAQSLWTEAAWESLCHVTYSGKSG